MDFGTNKSSEEVIKESLVVHILEIFIQVLMPSGIKIVGKNLIF